MANFLKAGQVLLSVFFLTVLVFSSEAQRSIDPELQRTIDDLVKDAYLPLANINGIGLAIASSDGELLYTTGYGLADQEKGIPNGNSTQFLIGSSSKSFISTIVVKVLHEKFPEMGEGVLDVPIRKLLPQVNFTLMDRFRSEQASFRDLIAHRLCLFRDDFQLMADPFNTSAEIVYRQRYNHEICGIRSAFQYNNQMYVAAGELIGQLAGKSINELVDELLTDIGMLNSTFVKKTDDFSQMPYRGQPYYVMDNISYPINTDLIKRVVNSNAAGGLYLTPNDMAKYTRFHLNLGKVDGRQVVPEECLRWMRKPSTFMDLLGQGFKTDPNDLVRSYYAYGLGLMIGSYDGWEHIQHGGYFPPYHTLLSLFPGKHLSIFTSTNMGPAMVDAQLLHETIFNIITGHAGAVDKFMIAAKKSVQEKLAKRQKEENTFKALIEKKKGQVSQDPSIVGKYGSGSAGDLEITEKFNSETNSTGLYLSYGSWATGWLELVAGDMYKLHYDTDLVQDNYAGGSKDGFNYLTIANETVNFVIPYGDDVLSLGTFKLGVSLDILPPVPWNPDSCGPE